MCVSKANCPPALVPDLSVDGSVEIERLNDVMYVGRPVLGQPNSTITLFKLDADRQGSHARSRKTRPDFRGDD